MKTLWLVAASLVWLVFMPVVRPAADRPLAHKRSARIRHAAAPGVFWAGTVWGTSPAGPIQDPNPVGWAYTSSGALTDVCGLAAVVPELRVVTRSPDLPAQLADACPEVEVDVVVDAP